MVFVAALVVIIVVLLTRDPARTRDSDAEQPADLRLAHGRWASVRVHMDDSEDGHNHEQNEDGSDEVEEKVQPVPPPRPLWPRPLPGPVPLILHQQTHSDREVPLAFADCLRGALTAHPIWHPAAQPERLPIVYQDDSPRNRTRMTDLFGKRTSLRLQCSAREEEANDSFAYWLWSDKSATAYVEDGSSRRDGDQLKLYFEAFRGLRSSSQFAHLLRYLVMYEFGGVFLSMDLQPLQTLVPFMNRGYPCTLLEQSSLKSESRGGAQQRAGVATRVTNEVLLCRPRHPFFRLVLDSLARLLGAIPRAHDTEVDEQNSNYLPDIGNDQEKAVTQVPFTDEAQIKQALMQGHGSGARFLSWALERYRSAHPELNSRCVANPAASPDCVHVAHSSSTPASTALNFARCSSKSSASGKVKRPAPPRFQALAPGKAQAQQVVVRRGSGQEENEDVGPTYPLSTLLPGFCS